MSRYRRPRGLMIWLVLLSLLWGAGCSRPDGLGSAAPADQHPVPFHDGDSKAPGSSNAGAPSAAQDKGQKPEGDLPFRDLQSLPAGTLLTVRLKSSVSADNPDASGTFEAVVDEPVTIEGYTLVPRGAGVAGRVESARASSASALASKVKGNGYFRVTLDSLDIAGKELRLQTSSLFARGNAAGRDAALGLITLEKGRRLTFRLTEPVYVALQQALPSR
jgi:hypothetical protein